jgi:ATP-dependent helicase YprA (DUF1998 family)
MMSQTNNYLDPIAVVEQSRRDYIRYLLTAYPLRDRHLRYGFKQLLEQPGNVWQHPYLEGSQPYQTGKSVCELVDSKVLHPETADLFYPAQRKLYQHQEQAFEAVIKEQENIVVATGTGSGKTECFLIPIIDSLLKEGEKNLIGKPGVRVLILYPMNALVNDQVKRLRQLLCRQKQPLIRFGFYTSRTETEKNKAQKALTEELKAYDPEELKKLFTPDEITSFNSERPEILVEKAVDKISTIQTISRQEFWGNPPHILVTNYSMLEHMLIRPKERTSIFAASKDSFRFLVVDEAHTYDGATGTEVSMLLKRLKAAVGKEEKQGQLRCIATSASLGDKSVDPTVLKFAGELFAERFSRVIRGDRVEAKQRLGHPFMLPDEPLWEYLQAITLPSLESSIEEWSKELSYFVPAEQLQAARDKVANVESPAEKIHQFLWFALKQHPIIHNLINILARSPQPWHQIARSEQLWGTQLPKTIEGCLDPAIEKQLERALAHLLQLGTLARENPNDLPLLPVRLHLLFRSIEGLYACINPECKGAKCDPEYPTHPRRYGRLYLNEKITCDECSSPVLELGSCSQCGQAYALTRSDNTSKLISLPRLTQELKENPKIYTLTSGNLDSVTEDEEMGEVEEDQQASAPKTFIIEQRDGWIGIASSEAFSPKTRENGEYHLAWHRHKNDKNLEGCYLAKCAACGVRPIRAQAINRFVAYTDEPLEAAIDTIFELLPERDRNARSASKKKLLTFSDGRQDAAFFASAYQRDRTEIVYRQILWQTFQTVKDSDGVASVTQLINQLKQYFLETSIPHPDRNSVRNYLSYCPDDEESLENTRDCQDAAESRAKELLLREFALPFNRRSTLEAYAILTCHIEPNENLIDAVSEKFLISKEEAQIFLTVLTDLIRRTGIVSIEGASAYFPETGGVEGVRPEMLDGQGKSKNYLFLEKQEKESKKYQDSPSFLPKRRKDGEISQAQNRLGWYYFQLFGKDRFPSRENLICLFQQFEETRLLVRAKSGYHLNWTRLNIIKTQQDWHQCDRCQHVFHIPGLSQLDKAALKVNAFGCPTYKCQGTLQPYTKEKIDRANKEHYQQYLIKNRLPLPLRSQEHTAQLSVVELEKRENRFRQGKINLLSSSTTLEMGVDIGELQAVVLRNFPPYVSNYQQRAGRAGRRTDGVAVTLMYGQRRPHDRFYFEEPERLIAGTNRIPQLDPDNLKIQQRHIRAELLATFLQEKRGTGAEKILIGDFLGILDDDFAPIDASNLSSDVLMRQLQAWLYSDSASRLAQQWLNRLGSQQTASKVIEEFSQALNKFEQNQIQDWNQLADVLQEIETNLCETTDRKQRKGMEYKRDRLEEELEKIAKRRLHDELAQAAILPIYGFPIDVVRLLTGESDEYKSSQGKHRLERDRRLALGEYAPGQDIVVDDRVYRSVGVVSPDDLERQFYWVCKNCNYFTQSQKEEEPFEACPECQHRPDPLERKWREYVIPRTFTTDWSQQAEVTPYKKPLRQPTSQVFLAQDGDNPRSISQPALYNLTYSRGGQFFLANQGPITRGKGFKNRGFAICQKCGVDLSDLVFKQQQESNKKSNRTAKTRSDALAHNHPLTGKPCVTSKYQYLHLGHEFKSDLLKIRFDNNIIGDRLLYQPVIHFGDARVISSVEEENSKTVTGFGFWHSLTYALLAAAAEVIDVPRSELDGLFRPTEAGTAEIVIYDNVPGGAGYSKRIAEEFEDILQKAYEIVKSCSCDRSCYDCLRTYSNQMFHAQLNRRVVTDFLQPLVERVKPDRELQAFAPNASRLGLAKVADSLGGFCRLASEQTIFYIPQFDNTLELNRGFSLPWLKLLTDAISSLQTNDSVLEIIISKLPESNLVLRKRLSQWIDQGVLKLYQSNTTESLTVCFNSQQSDRLALQLNRNEAGQPVEWLQTRSSLGVETVRQLLEKLRSHSRLIRADELEDPATRLYFIEPSSQLFTIAELRQKLGLETVLKAGKIKRAIYYDRYLSDRGAKILASLLESSLEAGSKFQIEVLENPQEMAASKRKSEIENAIRFLDFKEITCEVKVQPKFLRKHFPHARSLEIELENGQKNRVIFDLGIDFLEVINDRQSRIAKSTYIVVSFFSKNEKKH